MISWFISDIHLRDVNERSGNILLRFLFYLNQNPKRHRLFLLGDIFDTWVSDGAIFYRHYQPIVDQLRKLNDSGGEVHYFEGNHDFHVNSFWQKKFAIPVYAESASFSFDGLKLYLEHGDFINPHDLAYLNYRERVRTPFMTRLANTLPGEFWKWLGESHSLKSRKRTAQYAVENSENIRSMIRKHAHLVAEKEGCDLIINGHMHIYDDYSFEVNGRQVRAINLGTWLDRPRVIKMENNVISTVDLSLENHS